MKIGKIDLGFRPVMLAPMEDVTDVSFRVLCRKMGAAMVYSEFVSSDALVRMVNKSLAKLEIHEEERPVAIQIYGKEPEAVADAAKIVVEQAHPDVLDINFGCPVKKVAGKGAGAGLLRNVPLMLEITRAVVNAVSIPVTAKTRLGWDHDSIIIEQLAEQLLSIRRKNQQDEVNLMEDGTEKKLAQIDLDYQKELDAIDKQRKEWEKAQNGKLTDEQESDLCALE